MGNLFDPSARADLEHRLRQLTPTTQRRWGTLTVDAMVCHLGDQLRLALGELTTEERRPGLYSLPGLRWLLISVLPWPRARVATPSVFLTTSGEALEEARHSLLELIDRFVARGPRASWAVHPMFGRLSGPLWGRLAYRHIDYHLRQFGS